MTHAHGPQAAIFAPDIGAAVVRYQVLDLDASIAFYTQQLGFTSTLRSGPISVVTRGNLHLLLSGPDSSGSRALADGRTQQPGGFNRIVLYVASIDEAVATLRASGTRLRSAMQTGPGGKQIVLEDPDGNPVELHEAPRA